MLKRIICAILIALMLTCVFASCKKEDQGDQGENNGENGGENTDGSGENNEGSEGGGENEKPVDPENPQGLAFTLKDDGTYSVGIGEAGELTKIEIPATYKGVAVTEIGAIGDSTTTTSSNNVLTEVVLPDTITSISDKAFYNCRKLNVINIPEGVVSIGNQAFFGCNAIPSLTIPDSVVTIGAQAFYSCNNMTSIDIGTGVTSIGENAFTSCSSLVTVNVTDLAQWCSITFANNTSNPMSYAYRMYVDGQILTELTVPESVVVINPRAFYNCKSLISVTLHAGVATVGDDAFLGCDKLIEVINHSSLGIVAGGEGSGKIGLKALFVHSEESKLVEVDNYLFFSNNGNNYLLQYKGNDVDLVLPASMNGKNYDIYTGAFYYYKTLKSVVIPDSVKVIGENAFYMCNTMTSATIGKNVTTIANNAFAYCNKLESVVIPDTVKTIGTYAFVSNISMTDLQIGSGVTTVGEKAFANCPKLTGVHIKDFEAWCKITFGSYDANPLAGARKLYVNGELLTNAVIPTSVTKIGEYAFYYCDSITSVTLHDGITGIGAQAFAFCSNLSGAIYLPDTTTSIGDYAFFDCEKLNSIRLGTGLTTIGTEAFNYCYRLAEVINNSALELTLVSQDNGMVALYALEIHKGASKLAIAGDYIFYTFNGANYMLGYTGNDAVLVLPESYNGEKYNIGSFAFCTSATLTDVTLSSGVEHVGAHAFVNCTALKSVTVSDSVKSFGANAFQYCGVLSRVNITDLAKWCEIEFENGDANPLTCARRLFVNGELLTNLVIPEGTTYINPYVFYYCNSLTSVTLPSTLEYIGSSAFRYCYKLVEIINNSQLSMRVGSNDHGYICSKTLEIHQGASKVVQVGDYQFYTHKGVNYLVAYTGTDTEITLPESFNGAKYAIYTYAFFSNYDIVSVTVPDKVTEIGAQAFRFCNNLTTVKIGSGVITLGNGAFYSCEKLTSVTFAKTSGWKAGDTALTSEEVANAEQAATYLKANYNGVVWKRG